MKQRKLARSTSTTLFVAFMAGCAISASVNLVAYAKPTLISAHLVEPTTDPPPPPMIRTIYSTATYPSSHDHRHHHHHYHHNQAPKETMKSIEPLGGTHEPSIGSPLSSSSSSIATAAPSIPDKLSRSEAAAAVVEEEEEEEVAAQSRQQINQQHARSHHNHNQHQQQQLPSANTLAMEKVETKLIEQILAANLKAERRQRQTMALRNDFMSQQQATTDLESSLLSSPLTTGFIASDHHNRQRRQRRLIKRSGISDQKLAEMQMIRALKKQSERAASSRLAANISTANLELAST